ncbi:MAG: hypothetical protein LKE51_00135 [Selenomonas sp.]|jgi:hypothetical protein|nr:hypothetical protein [Selenomonas sp.]
MMGILLSLGIVVGAMLILLWILADVIKKRFPSIKARHVLITILVIWLIPVFGGGLYYLLNSSIDNNKQEKSNNAYTSYIEIPVEQKDILNPTGKYLEGEYLNFANNTYSGFHQKQLKEKKIDILSTSNKEGERKDVFLNENSINDDEEGNVYFDICTLVTRADKGDRSKFGKIDTIKYSAGHEIFIIKQVIYKIDNCEIYFEDDGICPLKKAYWIKEALPIIKAQVKYKNYVPQPDLSKEDMQIISDLHDRTNSHERIDLNPYIKPVGSKDFPTRSYDLSLRDVKHNSNGSVEFNILETTTWWPGITNKIFTIRYKDKEHIFIIRETEFDSGFKILSESRAEKAIPYDDVIKKSLSML